MPNACDANFRSPPDGKLKKFFLRFGTETGTGPLSRSHVAASRGTTGCARLIKPLQKLVKDGFGRYFEPVHRLNAMPHLGTSVMKVERPTRVAILMQVLVHGCLQKMLRTTRTCERPGCSGDPAAKILRS
jgi:hypothetical protein